MIFSRKQMKIVFFFSILFLLLIFSFFFLYKERSDCNYIKSLPYSIEIVDTIKSEIGINTETETLNFGKVSPGASVRRFLNISDTEEVGVISLAGGDLSSQISLAPQKFSLLPGEVKEVAVDFAVPESATAGNYVGEIRFCFRK